MHHRIAPINVNPAPAPAENPASGKITSEGSGGNRFSRAMSAPAPKPPSVSITDMAHPATPPICSPFGVAARGAAVAKSMDNRMVSLDVLFVYA